MREATRVAGVGCAWVVIYGIVALIKLAGIAAVVWVVVWVLRAMGVLGQ